MTEISYNNWLSMSDQSLAEMIGKFVRHHRLKQNRSQDEVSQSAGISRSTLSLLEKGETVTTASLIQVLRVLNQLSILQVFLIEQEFSPLALAKLEKTQRFRAGRKSRTKNQKTDW
jgi:transcriptional regulator with XRE-family HTH domain